METSLEIEDSTENSTHLVTEQEILDALAEVRAKCDAETANLLTAVFRGFQSLARCADIEAEILHQVEPDGKSVVQLVIRFTEE